MSPHVAASPSFSVPTTSTVLDNPASERVARVASLARRSVRRRYGTMLVEGPQSVRELLRFRGQFARDLYVTASAARRYPEIMHAAAQAGMYVHTVTPQVADAMSRDCQGVAAVAGVHALTAGEPPALRQALASARLVVALPQTQDPGNAGAIIRCADAAGADAVIVARGSVDPTSPKVVRSSAGSLFHLPVLLGADLTDVLDAARGAGIQVLAADAAGSVDVLGDDPLLARPTLWLMGNEAHGFDPGLLAATDALASIPIFGHAESLNVATAAAVCLYASARAQRAGRDAPRS